MTVQSDAGGDALLASTSIDDHAAADAACGDGVPQSAEAAGLGEVDGETQRGCDAGHHEEEAAGNGGDGGGEPPVVAAAGGQDDGARRAAARASVVGRARQLDADADPENVRAVLALAVAAGLPPGDVAYAVQELIKATKTSQNVLKLWLDDIRCSVDGAGVLHTRDQLARELERILGEGRQILWTEDTLHVYTPDGVGEEAAACGHFRRHSRKEVEDFLLQQFADHRLVATQAGRDEVIKRLASRLADPEFFEAAPKGLNLSNRFVRYDRATGRLEVLPPGPEHRARHRLAIAYDPAARAPEFLAGIARVIPNASRLAALQEFIGCLLLDATPGRDGARHALLLVGPQNSGKSTILALLRLLFPPDAVSEIPPEKWSNDYHRAALAGKRVNLVAELSDRRVIGGAVAKAILGFDRVDARSPFKEPFGFRPQAWHVLAANRAPRTDDTDPAFGRRFIAFRFDRSLSREEIDPDFLEKVSRELPGVLNWAFEGAIRAMARGYFELPDGHHEIIAEMQHGDDIVTRFVLGEVERAGDRPGVSTTALFDALKDFAERNGEDTSTWRPMTHRRKLARALKTIHGASRFAVNGEPHYSHVRLRPGQGAE
jgi:P4 family phage/plasmid primase-like protien